MCDRTSDCNCEVSLALLCQEIRFFSYVFLAEMLIAVALM